MADGGVTGNALSQFDAAYALIENAGVKLRMLDNSRIAKFPSNGMVALEKTLTEHRAEAVTLGRGYAMGTIFAMANPEAAVRILWAAYPQTKPVVCQVLSSGDEVSVTADTHAKLKAETDRAKVQEILIGIAGDMEILGERERRMQETVYWTGEVLGP